MQQVDDSSNFRTPCHRTVNAYGWSGFAPGVLEEIALMHEAAKPALVISEFGGAARALVAWILDDEARDLDLLQLDHQWQQARNAKLREVHAGLSLENRKHNIKDPGEAATRDLEERYQHLRDPNPGLPQFDPGETRTRRIVPRSGKRRRTPDSTPRSC